MSFTHDVNKRAQRCHITCYINRSHEHKRK
ncbi:Uncharacterised protein [Vibrio cholerae]|nr:Uncharacterised protein [Vibrio cholerae]